MLSFIAKKLRFQSVLKQNARQADAQAEESETQFSADIGENLKKLKAAFAPSSDLVFRDFAFSGGRKARVEREAPVSRGAGAHGRALPF